MNARSSAHHFCVAMSACGMRASSTHTSDDSLPTVIRMRTNGPSGTVNGRGLARAKSCRARLVVSRFSDDTFLHVVSFGDCGCIVRKIRPFSLMAILTTGLAVATPGCGDTCSTTQSMMPLLAVLAGLALIRVPQRVITTSSTASSATSPKITAAFLDALWIGIICTPSGKTPGATSPRLTPCHRPRGGLRGRCALNGPRVAPLST